MRRRQGFTLIELLVVVGIISILTAMLLPALRKAKAQAETVQCMSNLRQVYIGFQMYAEDFKNSFPWPAYWYDFLGDRIGKPESFAAITNLPRRPILECPSEGRFWRPDYAMGSVTMYEHDYMRSSYSWNFSIGSYAYGPPQPTRKGFWGQTINLGGRAAAPFVTDTTAQGGGWEIPNFGWGLNDLTSVNDYWNPYVAHMFRHPGLTANMLYLDGHIEPIRSILHGGPPTYVTLFEGEP